MSMESYAPEEQRKRKFASDCFKKATEAMARQNWDYAVEMFSIAIKMVPDNLMYRQSLRGLERRKYNDNKTGKSMAFLSVRSIRAKVKKSKNAKNWSEMDEAAEEGFLHIGEMSWTRVKHPSEVLQEGIQVDVVVLSLDRDKQKIGLGMRQLARNPWSDVQDRYSVGKSVAGKVTRVADFGAFIELEQGVEGLVHISELDHQRVRRVQDILAVGQEVQVQVLEVDADRQRISLSLKALKEKPELPKFVEPEPVPAPVPIFDLEQPKTVTLKKPTTTIAGRK